MREASSTNSMERAVRIQPLLCALLFLVLKVPTVSAQWPWQREDWTNARAVFHGGVNATGITGTDCGYGTLIDSEYTDNNTAVSVALFNGGFTCGACFAIICSGSKDCFPGKQVTVTTTNNCLPGSMSAGSCDSPKLYFELSYPAYIQLAPYSAGEIPIKYRRVPCQRKGGIRFTVTASITSIDVLVHNVGGMGDVCGVLIKGDGPAWYVLTRNLGQHYSKSTNFLGQVLSFQVGLCQGSIKQFLNLTTTNWQNGDIFEAPSNF